MIKALKYDLFASRKKCYCGSGLVYDGSHMICTSCYDVFCPNCFNKAVAEGGCFACAVCGWSICM
jgi:hypothetical protein